MNFIPKSPNKYIGNQIIINSDRLVFNAKQDSILLYSSKSIGFSTTGNFHFDTDNTENTKFIVNAPNIYLGIKSQKTGELPTEPAVLGKELETLLNQLLDFLELLLIDICYNVSGITTAPGTPTGMNPTNNSILDSRLKDIDGVRKSIHIKMSKNTKLM